MALRWLDILRVGSAALVDGRGRPLAVPGRAVPTAEDVPGPFRGANADDYGAAAQALLPQGQATIGSRLAALLRALAIEDARVEAAAWRLLGEADPRTTTALLSEWEYDFGLPDPCGGDEQTVEERRRALIARILDRPGGASIDYLVRFAAGYGYVITISEPAVLRAGFRAGDRAYGDDWLWAFVVHAPETTITSVFRAGSRADERLRTWGNGRLECLINQAKPAHTVALFAYGG